METAEGIQPEHIKSPKTELDLGAGKIIGLATEAAGLNIRTKRIIGKTEDIEGYPFSDTEKQQLGAAVARESKFQGAQGVKDARSKMLEARRLAQDARMSGAPIDVSDELEEEALSAWTTFEGKRTDYGIGDKVGFAEIDIQGNDVEVVVKSVPFPTYAQFAREGNPDHLLESSPAAGTAVIIQTYEGDGKPGKLLVQHRSERNRKYKGIFGASAAGMLDATKHQDPDEVIPEGDDRHNQPRRKRGSPDPVTTASIEENVMKEVQEEVGLERRHFKTVRAAGIGYDTKTPHPEVFFLAESNLSYDEIRKNAERTYNISPTDFAEKFTAIDATPQAIETLLTQIKHPLPPTHAAAFLAAAHSMILNDQTIPEERRLEEANSWITRVSALVKKNYQDMDEMALKHNTYRNKPYDPEELPGSQGLQSFETAKQTLEILLHPGIELGNEEQRIKLADILFTATDQELASIKIFVDQGITGIHELLEHVETNWDSWFASVQYAFGKVKGEEWAKPPSDPDTSDVFDQHIFLETREYLAEKGYEVVADPKDGDIVGYSHTQELRNGGMKETFEHFGVYDGEHVRSRFKRGGVYLHDLDAVGFDPKIVTTAVFFSKRSIPVE